MTRARDMANIAAGSFSIPSGSLANAVPADGSITTAKLAANAVTNAKLASGAITSAALPAGTVLQVVSTERTDATSWNGMADIFSLNITPRSASSKMLIQFSCVCSSPNRYNGFKLFRDSTQIALGDSAGNRARIWTAAEANNDETNQVYLTRSVAASYLDSPATTSQITYKVQGGNFYESTLTFYLNRAGTDTDHSYLTRGSTSLIITEIAG